jgi:chemotaxis protein CheC
MIEYIEFTNDELDVLGEVANIGMGKAGATLSEALDTFITLKVPKVRVVEVSNFQQTTEEIIKNYNTINIVSQPFVGDINGEAIILLSKSIYNLKGMLGYEEHEPFNRLKQEELILEISSSLTGACIDGMGEQLALNAVLSRPNIIGFEKPAEQFYDLLFGKVKPAWEQTLVIQVQFFLEGNEFTCEIIILYSQESLGKILNSVKLLSES